MDKWLENCMIISRVCETYRRLQTDVNSPCFRNVTVRLMGLLLDLLLAIVKKFGG